MKIGLTDIVKLTTAGYKPAEIKELHEMEDPAALTLALNGNNITDVKDLLSLVTPEDGKEPERVETEQPEGVAEPDYKKLYEELKSKSDDLEKTIKDIQTQNKRQNQQGETKTDDQLLADIVTSFM